MSIAALLIVYYLLGVVMFPWFFWKTPPAPTKFRRLRRGLLLAVVVAAWPIAVIALAANEFHRENGRPS